MTCTVSVVVPVHNGARHIAEALASVAAQTAPPAEVIVVDDGSTDGSADIAAGGAMQARVLRRAHAGVAAARNAGLALARGDAIVFLDHDDLWPPDALAALRAALDASPPPDIVHGRTRLFGAVVPPDGVASDRVEGFAVALGAAIIRRPLFDRIGGFAEDLRIGEDLDWLMRARERGCAMATVDRVTLWRRVHAGQVTADAADTMRAGAAVLKRSLDRRRADGRTARSLPSWPPRSGPQ